MVSTEGKNLIDSRTKSKIDYYFELLRIYYVNYKLSKNKFIENNKKLKQDCYKFIKENDIKVTYKENKRNNTTSQTSNTQRTKQEQEQEQEQEQKTKQEQKTDEQDDQKTDEQEQKTDEQRTNEQENKYALLIINKEPIYKEPNIIGIWKRIYRVICLYTHPDKTNSDILHFIFKKSRKKI